MPRMRLTFKDLELSLDRVGEAWAITVAGARYFLTAGDDPDRVVPLFLRARLRNAHPYPPALVASARYPLLLTVHTVIVRAWPAFVPRDRAGWSKTYINPATGDRVLAVEGPVWMFAARGVESSACGTVTTEQTVDDVADLATIWLRSSG